MARPRPQRRRAPDDADVTIGPFYIPSGASARIGSQSLKQGDTFAVLDAYGDAQAAGPAAEGLFHEDTRYLSRFVLVIERARPLLLSSRVTRDNTVLTADLANPDIYDGRLKLARDQVHLLRSKVLDDGACFERLEIRSYADHPVALTLRYGFDADFADMFEVRGQTRSARGEMLEPVIGAASVTLGYRGRDHVVRRTELRFDPPPDALGRREARYELRLPPGGALTVNVTVLCAREGSSPGRAEDFVGASAKATARVDALRRGGAGIATSNTAVNGWIDRSEADLDMLLTDQPTGPYPYAGIPWFNTAFGRDGIITALETLWLRPHVARGVLAFLAATQARESDPARDAETGKILHETRKSEMAALGEVPFGRYYGSVDATPLFVVLAACYHRRTGDTPFIQSIWPNIEAALLWMRSHGDSGGDGGGDGFLDYDRRAEKGLANQGWKDSGDAIFHADGRLATGPIALVEVQAYVYAALEGGAEMARALGAGARAENLATASRQLRRRFDAAFWCEEIGSYALALDGGRKPCRVRTSNAGHALFAGICEPARAARLAATLMSEEHFSGWGIRTLATSERRYNPMSYHNGSIWPHDNGLIAMGLARYGLRAPLLRLIEAQFDASTFLELHRLPELFCGFPRRPGEGPTHYPVACSPQAWSSAAAFALIGAVLGVSFHPEIAQIRFTRPALPRFIDELRIERLSMGEVAVDLHFRRHGEDAALTVLRKDGEVEIVVTG
jgi:glycogen debranching enzyme